MNYFQWTKTVASAALALTLSGCLTMGSGPAPSEGPQSYASSSSAGLHVNGQDFNAQEAPHVCVNDLAVYRAHLQMPASSSVDLNKPVRAYVQEAGSAGAAIEVVNAELNTLKGELDGELANRNPFDLRARARSDDAIGVLEDGILLNEALVEALECRR